MNFTLYSYYYSCPRWYGNQKGFNNIFVESDEDEITANKLAKTEMELKTGSKTCDIKLLNKFDMVIKSSKTYSSLTGLDIQKIRKNFLKESKEIHKD